MNLERRQITASVGISDRVSALMMLSRSGSLMPTWCHQFWSKTGEALRDSA